VEKCRPAIDATSCAPGSASALALDATSKRPVPLARTVAGASAQTTDISAVEMQSNLPASTLIKRPARNPCGRTQRPLPGRVGCHLRGRWSWEDRQHGGIRAWVTCMLPPIS
jgi:hypothetical protein